MVVGGDGVVVATVAGARVVITGVVVGGAVIVVAATVVGAQVVITGVVSSMGSSVDTHMHLSNKTKKKRKRKTISTEVICRT